MKILTLIFLFVFIRLSVAAPSPSITLKKVYSNKTMTFYQNPREKQLIIFTSPKCSACHRQLKDLSCLGSSIKTYLVAISGKEKELNREYGRKSENELFLGFNEAVEFFSIKPKVTPQLMLRSPGQIYYFLGYTECRKIKKYLASAEKPKLK